MITVVKLPSASLSATPNQTTQATPSDPGSPLGMQMFAITSAGSNGTSSVRHNYQYEVTIQERCRSVELWGRRKNLLRLLWGLA